MKKSQMRTQVNTFLLFGILVSNTLYRTIIGGEGSIYSQLSFFLALGLILRNRRFDTRLASAFGLPVILLMLSMAVNFASLTSGSFHSGLLIATGFALLTLKPIPLDGLRLRKLVVAYVFVSLGVSFYFAATADLLVLIRGNPNFNINPNGASLYFFGCLVLSLVYTSGGLRMFLAIAFSLFMVTTGSRGGLVSGVLTLVGFVLMSTGIAHRPFWRSPFAPRRLIWMAGLAALPTIAVLVMPQSVDYLRDRFAATGFTLKSNVIQADSRDVKWRKALDVSQESLTSIFLGHGPATATEVATTATHSSYVEAFVSLGWPFLLSTVFATLVLCMYHIKRGQRDFAVYAIGILLYGSVETVLFNGMGSIWFIFILLSLSYRSATPATIDLKLKARRPRRQRFPSVALVENVAPGS